MSDVTRILSQIESGDPSAAEKLLPLVYDELRELAAAKLAQEKPGQTLQATALVHEAYIRLVEVETVEHWDSRGHFFSAAAGAMRRILVEHARSRAGLKHGGNLRRVGEMLRIIREEEPPRPSTKLSSSPTLPSVAANRGTEPARLSRTIRGELDWIGMKALEKDRNRRYETANGLALDIQHYLADEPVQACPPSAVYGPRKFVRRNRSNVVAAGLLLLVLAFAGGAAGYTLSERAARQARVTAQVEPILADVVRLIREQKWPEALDAARRAEAAAAGGDAGVPTRHKVSDLVRDLRFVARLEQIRMRRANIFEGHTFDNAGAVQDYRNAFQEFGVDIESVSTDAAASALKGHPAIVLPLSEALDDWGDSLRILDRARESTWRALFEVARRLDPEPVRDQWRASWAQDATPNLQSELRRLAEAVDAPPRSVSHPTSKTPLKGLYHVVSASMPFADFEFPPQTTDSAPQSEAANRFRTARGTPRTQLHGHPPGTPG